MTKHIGVQPSTPGMVEMRAAIERAGIAAWWRGPWRAPDPESYDREKHGPTGEFNPACKHDRTSYDILTCDACINHTKQLEHIRARAAKAHVVSGLDEYGPEIIYTTTQESGRKGEGP